MPREEDTFRGTWKNTGMLHDRRNSLLYMYVVVCLPLSLCFFLSRARVCGLMGGWMNVWMGAGAGADESMDGWTDIW